MRRNTPVGLVAAVIALFGLIASASVFAKDLGPSVKIPEDAKVQMLYDGHFIIKVAGARGSSGIFECTCAGGGGTCEVNSIMAGGDHRFVCLRGKTGTCDSSCTMTTTGTGGP